MSPIRRELVNALLILAGIFSAAMGLKGFLFSSHFIDGGVTGISMLLAQITPWPLAVWLPVVNAPFIVLGYRQMGPAFALRSLAGIAGLALVLAIVPFPDVTADSLLTAVFGGVFIGAGIALAIRGGAVIDGTEIVALLIGRRSHVFKVGDVILAFNILLFVIAMSVLGRDAALYSILTYVAAARTLEFVLHGIEEFTAVTIVSPEGAAIRRGIVDELGRGVTLYRARGGKTGEERDVVFCVVTRLEIGRVMRIVNALDRSAFVVQHAVADVRGGVLRRPLHA